MTEQLFRFAVSLNDGINSLPNSGTNDAPDAKLGTILEVVFATLGVIAFLIIVIAGLRYILAGGDPSKVANARNTILYAVIGLVVSLSAYSIVYFVVGNV